MSNIIIIGLLLLIAIILLCAWFIIRAFNDINEREKKIQVIETFIQQSDIKIDAEWFVLFESNIVHRLRRAVLNNDGKVSDVLKDGINEMTKWLLQTKS